MRSFYATICKTDCLQILYKFCKNWFSVPNIVHQLTLSLRCNHWKIQNSGDFQDAINSIHCSANGRSKANDVSFLWCHSSWSRSWRLKRAYRRPFLTVLGEFEPQNVVVIVWTPKRHFLTSQRVFWAISREIPCTGYFSRRVLEKIKIKIERPYISRISPGNLLRPISTYFGLHVCLVDIINCAKFYCNRLWGLDSLRGRILTIPIGLWCRR